jgi:hypothetical protein
MSTTVILPAATIKNDDDLTDRIEIEKSQPSYTPAGVNEDQEAVSLALNSNFGAQLSHQ